MKSSFVPLDWPKLGGYLGNLKSKSKGYLYHEGSHLIGEMTSVATYHAHLFLIPNGPATHEYVLDDPNLAAGERDICSRHHDRWLHGTIQRVLGVSISGRYW